MKHPSLPPARDGTIRALAERYVAERMVDAGKVTVGQFRRCFLRLHRHYGRDVLVEELTDALVADHMRWLLEQEQLRPVSINSSHRSYILTVWRFALDVGLLDRGPRVRRLKEFRHEPDSWTIDEMRRLVNATRVFDGVTGTWIGVVPRGRLWKALLLTAYWTGLRLGSLFKLRMADVDFTTRWLYVSPEASKNRRGKKYRIDGEAIAALLAIRRPERELLFPWPYRREAVWRDFRRIQRAAGIPDSPLSTRRFHMIRRTSATHAAVHAGMPAAIALLDHSGPEVTKRYLDPSKMPGTDATAFLPAIGAD